MPISKENVEKAVRREKKKRGFGYASEERKNRGVRGYDGEWDLEKEPFVEKLNTLEK